MVTSGSLTEVLTEKRKRGVRASYVVTYREYTGCNVIRVDKMVFGVQLVQGNIG